MFSALCDTISLFFNSLQQCFILLIIGYVFPAVFSQLMTILSIIHTFDSADKYSMYHSQFYLANKMGW